MAHTVLLALLAFCATASAVDTEGTNFVFAFVRNANSDITNQVLSATIINRNANDCKFTLTYRADYHKSTNPENVTFTVLSMNANEQVIPSWYGWNYAGQNVQDDVYLTLMAYSTCPITLLANNYDSVTKQGDTYLVLPTSWGSQSFTFSLPPAIVSATVAQYEQVFVLPTTEGDTRVTFVEIGNAQSVFYFNATYGNSPAVYVGAKTTDSRPRTYHVMSDKPVLIVAGTTCAGTDPSGCDHVAYMPHPPPASDCYAYDYYDDDHLSYLPTTSQFFTDIPGSCLMGQNITRTLNDGTTRTITIKPQKESPLWTVTPENDKQVSVAFHNGGSNIHIARYYDGTKYASRGAFIATSPSITQFHADNSAFYTRNANDFVEIYCTVIACSKLTLDGAPVYNAEAIKATQQVDGVTYWIFVHTIANPGFHNLYLDPATKGNYAYFVTGKNGQYSYGYEGGANKPTFVLAPATTTTPNTAPTTTGTTVTVPTVTVPTVTVPTVTVPTVTVPTVTVPTVTVPIVSTSTNAPVTTATIPSNPPSTASTGTTATTSTTPLPTTTTNTPAVTTTVTLSTTVTTSTQVPVTTATTPTTVTTSTQAPVTSATSSTTVTTPTQAPVTTASTPSPTSPTTVVTTPTIPTTTQTAAPTSATTVVTSAIVTTASTTVGPSQSTGTPVVTVATQPVTTPTTPAVTTPTTPKVTQAPVTTPTTTTQAPPPATTSTKPVVTTRTTRTTKTTTTTTTTTAQPPSTSTQSASVISLALPAVLTILFAFF